jgi:hypothetical protein
MLPPFCEKDLTVLTCYTKDKIALAILPLKFKYLCDFAPVFSQKMGSTLT